MPASWNSYGLAVNDVIKLIMSECQCWHFLLPNQPRLLNRPKTYLTVQLATGPPVQQDTRRQYLMAFNDIVLTNQYHKLWITAVTWDDPQCRWPSMQLKTYRSKLRLTVPLRSIKNQHKKPKSAASTGPVLMKTGSWTQRWETVLTV